MASDKHLIIYKDSSCDEEDHKVQVCHNKIGVRTWLENHAAGINNEYITNVEVYNVDTKDKIEFEIVPYTVKFK